MTNETSTTEKESKLARRELAQEDFNRFMEMWDIDTDRDFMDADTVKNFDEIERQVIREIMRGRFIVRDDDAVFKLKEGSFDNLSEVTLTAPRFGALVKTDQHKAGQDIKKMNELISALTGQPPATIAKLTFADGMFLQACANLFFSR